jgi:hypothetical protein
LRFQRIAGRLRHPHGPSIGTCLVLPVKRQTRRLSLQNHMNHKNATTSVNPDGTPKVNVTPAKALSILIGLPVPTLDNLAREMPKLGFTVSISTLKKWSVKNCWMERVDEAIERRKAGNGEESRITGLKLDAIGFDHRVFIGLKARAAALETLELTKATDFPVMAEFIDALDKLAHDQRGAEVGDRKPGATKDAPVSGGVVSLGEFSARKT